MFSPSNFPTFSIVVSLFHYFDFSPSYFRLFIIVLSRFHHRSFVITAFHYYTIAFSPSYCRLSLSYYRLFTIVLSRFHNRTIDFSLFHHRNIAFLSDMHIVRLLYSSCKCDSTHMYLSCEFIDPCLACHVCRFVLFLFLFSLFIVSDIIRMLKYSSV